MWNSSSRKQPKQGSSAPQEQAGAPPKDALSALMDGKTPSDRALKFPNEASTAEWRAKPDKPSKNTGKFDEYSGDYRYDNKSPQYPGEFRPQQQNTALDSVKTGAANTGNYIKTKSNQSAAYVKEKDWSKEKEMAGKAGTATKNGAIYVGSGVAKGASWLWNSGKSGVDNMRSKK